jgi:hypothetical protein
LKKREIHEKTICYGAVHKIRNAFFRYFRPPPPFVTQNRTNPYIFTEVRNRKLKDLIFFFFLETCSKLKMSFRKDRLRVFSTQKIQVFSESKNSIPKKTTTKFFTQLTIHSQFEQKSVKNSSENASFKETKKNRAHHLRFHYFIKY